jgi:hypothetical protein
LVVAVWAVIGAHTLCTVGVLAHECRCDVECVCDHESECEADPCGEVLLRKDDNVYSAVVTKPAATVHPRERSSSPDLNQVPLFRA